MDYDPVESFDELSHDKIIPINTDKFRVNKSRAIPIFSTINKKETTVDAEEDQPVDEDMVGQSMDDEYLDEILGI